MSKYILIVCGLLLSGVVLYFNITHNRELKNINREHAKELLLFENKYQARIESMKEEYEKLEHVYIIREKDIKEFQEKQQELLNDIDRLNRAIEDKPEVTGTIINDSFSDFMKRVFDETNSNVVN